MKQKNLPWVGAVTDSLFTALPILSIINFLSIITVLYATIREYLFKWVPWLSFPWFLAILVVATLIMMVGTYLFVLPSLWTFRNKQMNSFESEILKEIKELRDELKEVRK